MSTISIALCSDLYNLPGLFITMNSIYKNCSMPARLQFLVLVDDSKLKRIIDVNSKKLFGDLQIHVKVLTEGDKQRLLGYTNYCENNKHCKNIMNFSRFLLSDIFSDVPSYIYIDTDYLVLDDIVKLWDGIDKTEELYAVPSEMSSEFIYNFTPLGSATLQVCDRPPFNTGIYLVNSELWKKNKRTEQFIELVNSEKIQRLFRFGTQPLLNYVYHETYIYLPTRWNRIAYDNMQELGNQRPIDIINALPQDQIIKEDISAIHFAGVPKPWLFSNQLAGGSFPSPNSIYKQYLPYKENAYLNKDLLAKHPHLVKGLIKTANEVLSLNLLFIHMENDSKRFHEFLDSQSRTTSDTYASDKYYVLLNGNIIENQTGIPDQAIEVIAKDQTNKEDGVYILTIMEDNIHINRKNIFEKIQMLDLNDELDTDFRKYSIAHALLFYLL
jgi:lipopolysaccharide biosynthesis glycosyltransferase